MKPIRAFFHRPFFIRLFNWEYWSFNAIYGWIMPWWLLLAFRSRSLYFFSAANPGIENGGMLNESKKDIHNILPKGLYPATLHFSIPANPDAVWNALQAAGMGFPLMGKPDIGGRGRGVKKITNRDELDNYVRRCTLDFHMQSYIPFEQEVGIFYHRLPGEQKGKITGIVRKEFLRVVGDGSSSVRALLKNDRRGIMYLENLEKIQGGMLDQVPAAGEKRVVSPYGNHARGALFLDDTHRADEKLHALMDGIADQIPGFFFGRLGIRYRDWDTFRDGKDFCIIELNGAGAEPTHMYDPRHSLFFAHREIVRHWKILQKIEMFRKDREISAKLALMPE